jgi:mRNA-degrading endonuclease RelE of RelBE toxin-antitoxin system
MRVRVIILSNINKDLKHLEDMQKLIVIDKTHLVGYHPKEKVYKIKIKKLFNNQEIDRIQLVINHS